MKIHPAVKDICPLGLGHAHTGQMGKCLWHCPNKSLENSTELRTENIDPMVSEICILTNGHAHLGQMGSYGKAHMRQIGKWLMLHNYGSRPYHRSMNLKLKKSMWFQICVLVHEQAHMLQMGKWPQICPTISLENLTNFKLRKSVYLFLRYVFCNVWMDPNCTIFDKLLAHVGQMGKWSVPERLVSNDNIPPHLHQSTKPHPHPHPPAQPFTYT